MDFDEAKRLAEVELLGLQQKMGHLLVFTSEPESGPFGWIFFFNTAAYVKSGDLIADGLLGPGPILVSPSGSTYILPSYLDIHDPKTRSDLQHRYS